MIADGLLMMKKIKDDIDVFSRNRREREGDRNASRHAKRFFNEREK
jgi:hypothetical protein